MYILYVLALMQSNFLEILAFRHTLGGGMWDRTGGYSIGVEFSLPSIIHISVFWTVSKCFVYLLPVKPEEQYSAAEYTRARLAVRRMPALDSQLVPTSFQMMFTLVLISSVTCFTSVFARGCDQGWSCDQGQLQGTWGMVCSWLVCRKRKPGVFCYSVGCWVGKQ